MSHDRRWMVRWLARALLSAWNSRTRITDPFHGQRRAKSCDQRLHLCARPLPSYETALPLHDRPGPLTSIKNTSAITLAGGNAFLPRNSPLRMGRDPREQGGAHTTAQDRLVYPLLLLSHGEESPLNMLRNGQAKQRRAQYFTNCESSGLPIVLAK